MTNKDIIAKLDELKIPHDGVTKAAALKALLPKDVLASMVEAENAAKQPAESAPENGSETFGDVQVGSAEALKPVELPLVVTPAKGVTFNAAQTEYAKTLNGYAYKNPAKWAKKRAKLIANLNELGTNPEKLASLKGEADSVAPKLKYEDKRISNSN